LFKEGWENSCIGGVAAPPMPSSRGLVIID
jgi:hypothetical protein